MIKFARLFVKIIYFVLTALFGIILIFTLPYIFYNTDLSESINDCLENKQYVDAMDSIGCYYDVEPAYVYEDSTNNVQLVLFRAVPFVSTTYTITDVTGQETYVTTQETVELGYYGFLCNVGGKYDTDSSKETEDFENKTRLLVNNNEVIHLLDFDDNNDNKNDCVLTLLSYTYVTFSLSSTLESVESLEFIDKTGNSFLKLELTNPLDFNNDFFNSFKDFVREYNTYIENTKLEKITTEEASVVRTQLSEKVKTIFDSNTNYKNGTFAVSIRDSKVKAYTIVGIYFAAALMLGDLIVGKRFIIQLTKRIFQGKKKDKPTIQR